MALRYKGIDYRYDYDVLKMDLMTDGFLIDTVRNENFTIVYILRMSKNNYQYVVSQGYGSDDKAALIGALNKLSLKGVYHG